jgi:hypothetical protein
VQVYFYKVFQTDGAFAKPFKRLTLEHSPAIFGAEHTCTVINCLAFSPTGSHFCIGCADSNAYVISTSFLTIIDTFHIDFIRHRSVLDVGSSVILSCITAVAFGGQGDDERIVVGDRHGNVRAPVLPVPFYVTLFACGGVGAVQKQTHNFQNAVGMQPAGL